MDPTSFGQWLKDRRKTLDFTQATLGHLTGCSESSIRKIESGILKPSRQVAELLAATLGVQEGDREDFIKWARSTPGAAQPAHLPAAPSPAPAPTPAPATLPVPPTELIGRKQDVADVLSLLGRDGLRLLTLTGPPGTGKTRLSLQAATEAAGRFRDGVLFVPLAHISDPELVISTISRALGLGEARGVTPVQALAGHLRDLDMLLILDNFEQIIPAAPDIAELLAAISSCKFIVTSREALHLRGEQIYPVPPLALPADALEAEELAEVPAVALFVQRARDTDPAFRLTEANAADVAAICHRLDGLPLAIELAAARIAILPPDALLARMVRRLSLLTDGARDLPERQRTLRNAIASSYDLLDASEQHLFRHLSIFAGGGSLEAIIECAMPEAPAGQTDGNTLDLIASLQAKSLIRREADGGDPRFVMLEMIREYALEALQLAGEETGARRSHALYFMNVAEEAEPLIMGGKQMGALEMLERDLANLRAALTWAHGAGDEGIDISARMCAALSRFWLRRGHWTEGRRWIDETLALLEKSRDSLAAPEQAKARREKHARMLHMAGAMAYRQGDYHTANAHLRASIDLWRNISDRPGNLAEVLQDVGTLAILRDEYGRARETLTEALEIHRRSGSKQGISQILTMLGFEAMAKGDFDRSSALLHEALEIFREMGDRWGILRVQQHIAVLARNMGDFALAQRLLEENLATSTELDNKSGIAASLGELGMLALAQGHHEKAATLTKEVLEIYTALGGKSVGAVAILTLGLVALYRGDYDEAQAHCLEALEIFHHEEARYDTASSLMSLAGVASAQGQGERAARLLGAAEAIFNSLGAHMDYFSRILQSQITAQLSAAMDSTAFTAARQAGSSLTIDQAYQLALTPNTEEDKRPATAP
ncbi:MAG: tetratricopeptide repeat protein [Chloroflexota bacterium]